MFVTLFLLVSIWSLVFTGEPECSSFHFVEKTLEKMIKTEIYVDKLKTEMETKQKGMFETLDAIKTDLEKTKLELKASKEDTKQLYDNLKAKSTGLTQTSGVAFLAHDLNNTELENGETMVFVTTEFDRGSGYDNTTGVYVTPISGVYMFNLQLCIDRYSSIYFEIESGSAPILKGSFGSYRISGCHTATTVAILDAGENVRVNYVSSSYRGHLYPHGSSVVVLTACSIMRTDSSCHGPEPCSNSDPCKNPRRTCLDGFCRRCDCAETRQCRFNSTSGLVYCDCLDTGMSGTLCECSGEGCNCPDIFGFAYACSEYSNTFETFENTKLNIQGKSVSKFDSTSEADCEETCLESNCSAFEWKTTGGGKNCDVFRYNTLVEEEANFVGSPNFRLKMRVCSTCLQQR